MQKSGFLTTRLIYCGMAHLLSFLKDLNFFILTSSTVPAEQRLRQIKSCILPNIVEQPISKRQISVQSSSNHLLQQADICSVQLQSSPTADRYLFSPAPIISYSRQISVQSSSNHLQQQADICSVQLQSSPTADRYLFSPAPIISYSRQISVQYLCSIQATVQASP